MTRKATPAAGAPRNPYQGKTIARCKVGERLGRGRTSHVFSAFYEPLEKDIAIKILSGDLAGSEELRESFVSEARAAAKLDNEHVVKVLDVVEDQGHICILMEMVQGDTLQDRLKDKGPLPPRKAARIACQIAEALASAHAEKIVHRDIKPANVMLTAGSDQVKVVDFGLAGSQNLANRAGTPHYMSPEACQGKRVDEKSDVYALGVCLFQMLTGALPFSGKSVKAILAAHIEREPPTASSVRADLGTEFDGILKKLLVKSKGYRPSAADAVKLLEPLFADGMAGTKPDKRAGGARRGGGRRKPLPSEQKKSPVPIILGIVAIVVAAIGLVVMASGKEEPPPVVLPTTTKQPIKPPVVDAPPLVDPSQEAFNIAYDWAKMNPGNDDAVIAKFKAVEDKFPGSPWAEKARKQRERVEEEIRALAATAARQKEREAAAEEAKAARKLLDALCDEFAWRQAAAMASTQKNLPDEPFPAWQARQRRLEYLADEFAKHLNEGLAGNPKKLNLVDPKAPAVRDIVGAGVDGLKWSDGSLDGVLGWAELKGNQDGIFGLAKRITSQSKPEGLVFLSVLAAELWYAEGEDNRKSKNYRELVELVDDARGIGRAAVQRYFSKR